MCAKDPGNEANSVINSTIKNYSILEMARGLHNNYNNYIQLEGEGKLDI